MLIFLEVSSMRMKSKPQVVVIGLGAYFKKIRQGLSQYFENVQLIDVKPCETLDLHPGERTLYSQTSGDLSTVALHPLASCVMLLTPPAVHIPHIEQLARFQLPILVEKPLAIQSTEIPRLMRAVEHNPRLYCSDFYADIRALPLLRWMNPRHSTALDAHIHVISGDPHLWEVGRSRLGPLQAIEAYLYEGSGESGSFDGREWLWEPLQGGVALDLLYHYFTLLAYLFDFDGDFIPEKIVFATTDDQGKHLPWYPEDGRAETYALVTGQLASGIPFHFETAKYWPAGTQRHFTLHFASGTASLHFGTPNRLRITSGQIHCDVQLEGSAYTYVGQLFCTYVCTGPTGPYGLQAGLSAIRAVDTVKRLATEAVDPSSIDI